MSDTQTESIESLVELYNKFNNTIFVINDLVCSMCKKWLTNPILRNHNNKNICNNCKDMSSLDETYFCNGTIDLKDGKYPCRYHACGCKVFETYTNIFEHECTCNFNMSCFCKEILNEDAIIPHLVLRHKMETIQLKKPVAEINVQFSPWILNVPYQLSIGLTSLIVVLSYNFSSNEVNVIVSNITGIPRNMKFMATFTHEGIGYFKYGTVFNHFTSTSTKDPLTVKFNDNLTLKIYFENYEKIESLMDCFEFILKDFECPICLECISDSYYQCENGHNVCDTCKKMIAICPTCRYSFKACAVTMKRLTAHFIRPCKYAENGCFVYDKNSEIVDHERICQMGKITCELCTDEFYINAYIDHMTIEHNMQKLDETPAIVKPGFIFYRCNVFEFTVQHDTINALDINKNIKLCKWSLRLIYSSKKMCTNEFEMAITFCERSITFKQKISNCEYRNVCNVDHAGFPIFTITFLF